MKKIIDELINLSIKGVDVYRYKNATWLIFTNEVRWVVELTDEGTLWYNFTFFNNIFKYVSMEVGEQTEKYIIEWANDFFYKDCAHRSIAYPRDKGRNETPKVLKNGINQMRSILSYGTDKIEKVVNGGVKEIKPNLVDVIFEKQRRCYYDPACDANVTFLTDIIEEGVKEVKPNVVFHGINKKSMSYVPCNANTTDINHIVKEGVKNVYPDTIPGEYDWRNEFDTVRVIDGGVKL